MWPWRYQLVLLSVLAAQNTILVLLIKSSLAASTHPTTLNVIAVELVKIAICLLLELPRHHYHPQALLHSASADPQKHRYTLPAILYALQNNLCLLAMSRMSAVEYQVLYQCKILVTAVMAWWWLKRPITGWQWVSLVLLVAGVSVVAVPGASVSGVYSVSGGGWGEKAVGMGALAAASMSSGYCGVYLERLAKDASQKRRSVALQSIGLAFYSLPVAIVLHLLNGNKPNTLFSLPRLLTDSRLLLLYIMQATSGMLVGAVIRHSDNILKGFATSVSLVASAMLTEPGNRVVVGTVIVALAVCLFGVKDAAGCKEKPQVKRVKSLNI